MNNQSNELPDNWQPGDICRNCRVILIAHRERDRACPDVTHCCIPTSNDVGHVHTDACWREIKFERAAS